MAKRYHFLINNKVYVAIKYDFKNNTQMLSGQMRQIHKMKAGKGDVSISELRDADTDHPSKGSAHTLTQREEAKAWKQRKKTPGSLLHDYYFELNEWDEVVDKLVEIDESKTAPSTKQYLQYDKDQKAWKVSGHKAQPNTVANGKFIFVTMPSGTIRIGMDVPGGGGNAHSQLSGCVSFVRYAGCALFDKGSLVKWNNKSGSYAISRMPN